MHGHNIKIIISNDPSHKYMLFEITPFNTVHYIFLTFLSSQKSEQKRLLVKTQ